MPRKLANKPHTSGTKLNWIINQQSTAIEATFQKLHQVLIIVQPKNLRFNCIPHLIVGPFLDGIPKRKSIQTIVFLSKHPHSQIQMGN